MLTHVGVLIFVMNYILLSAFVGACIDCKNIHSMNNVKQYYNSLFVKRKEV